MAQHTLVFVGLGNPGDEYKQTRHNAGFLAIENLAGEVSWKVDKDLKSWVASGQKNGVRCLFVKPTTFMNASGEAVAAVLNYYKQDLLRLWVLHDDLDLELGKSQIRFGGGTAGHHGLESVVAHTHSAEFGRIRIGIRGQALRQHHSEVGIATHDFVMGRFDEAEQKVFNRMIEALTPMIEKKVIAPGPFETTTVTA